MHAIVNIALKAARDASEVLAHNIDRLDRVRVVEQNGDQAITNMDLDSEKTIIYHLQKAYPDYTIQSRVSGTINGRDTNNVWIIDPLCGNVNYMRGISHFCVSVALATDGRVNHAVLVNPMLREEFTASRGTGAQTGTQRLRVSKSKTLEKGFVSLDSAPLNAAHSEKVMKMQQSLYGLQCEVRLTGCPALDLAWVAAGRLDAGWLGENDPSTIAAAILILQESGALISDAAGNPEVSSGADLIFGNPKCFKQMLQFRQAAGGKSIG